MKREFQKHKLAYLVLIFGLIFFTTLFLGGWPNQGVERLIIIGMSLFYMIWGIVTHLKSEHISRRIVLEYIGAGVLAGFLLTLITF